MTVVRRSGEPRDYSYRTVVDRIRAELDYRHRRDADLYRRLGISKDQWSRKMRVNAKGVGGHGSSFTLDEIAKIADALHPGVPGWPFVDDQELKQYVRDLDPLEIRFLRGAW
jgi:hypothetical protein